MIQMPRIMASKPQIDRSGTELTAWLFAVYRTSLDSSAGVVFDSS